MDAISPSLLFLILIIVAFVAFLAYGQLWSRRFEARVPLTTMNQVELAVGKPGRISTNSDGFVVWNYTRWWSGTAKVYFDTNGIVYRIFTE